MASIVREVAISAPAARCWEALRAFDALHERLAVGFVTELSMVSERDRRITFVTGSVATERLLGIDEESMRLAYAVIDGPLNATHFNAAAQVIPDGPAACRFTWAIDVLPDELAGPVADLMAAGLRAIAATLGGPATAGAEDGVGGE
jgi:Polyketide cyclase / dehydrase and lipid transport